MPDPRVSPFGLLAAVGSCWLLLAFSTSTASLAWAPKAAFLPVLAALVPLLLFAAGRAGVEVRPAVAFLAVAAVATTLAPNPTIAVFGGYRQGTGLIFVAALVGAWALGALLNRFDRRLLEIIVVSAIGLNIALAALSLRLDLSSLGVPLYGARAMGLMGNPVHLASSATGLGMLAMWRLRQGTRWAGALAAAAAGLQISGSRAGIVVVALGAVAVLARAPKRLFLAGSAIFVGLILGTTLLGSSDVASTSRIAALGASGGYIARLENWRTAASAVADRPLVGFGPGSYGVGVTRHRTLRLARAEGGDSVFSDAHNIFVEYAVTTGLAGLVAFVLWLALALRRSSGPMLALALGILSLHLVQPQFVGTTPLAFLALGAAGPVLEQPKVRQAVLLPLVGVGLALAAILIYGDFRLRQAELDFKLADARAANTVLPRWSVTAEMMAKLHAYRGITTDDDRGFEQALRWRRVAALREPTATLPWIDLGQLQLTRSMPVAAKRSFERALQSNPQSFRARIGLVQSTRLLGGHTAYQARLLEEAQSRAVTPEELALVEKHR